ncbi:MAG: hypothetical protein K2J63_11860 [Muribaculaceae bacterium]|nr:hypothetical protein [Muribaculaceae bacterium]
MKKLFFKLPLVSMIGVFMLLLLGVSACSDDNDTVLDGDLKTQIKDYPLPERFFIYDKNDSNTSISDLIVLVIESSSKLKTVFGEDANELEKFDFDSYKLIYVQGIAPNNIENITSKWSYNKSFYKISFDVTPGMLCVMTPWSKGFLLPKGMNKKVKAEVNYYRLICGNN